MGRFKRGIWKFLNLSTSPTLFLSSKLQAEGISRGECLTSKTCVNQSTSESDKADLQGDPAKVKQQNSASSSISLSVEEADDTAHSARGYTASPQNIHSIAVGEIARPEPSNFQPDPKDYSRYSIPFEQPLSDNTGFVVAPITSNGEVSTLAAIPSTGPGDVVADESKLDGTFRRIHVRFDGDPEGSRARVQHIMHDTGSGVSLAFESKMHALGLNFEPVPYNTTLTSVTGEQFHPIGRRRLCFSYFDHPNKEYWTDIIILSDPLDGSKPAFDILFGRDTIRKAGALTYNHEVIGINYVQTAAFPTPAPLL